MGRLAYAPYAYQVTPEGPSAEAPRAYAQLRERLAELHDLDRAREVLAWDERTMMPDGGGAARADQITALTRLRHERMTSPELGHLLDQIEPWAESMPYHSDEASLVRIARRDHEKARCVPGDLKAEIAHAASEGEHVWREARARSDYALFLPYLRHNLELALRYVACFPDASDPYDPLLDDYEPGVRIAELAPILEDLRTELVPLVRDVTGRNAPADDACLRGDFPIERQRALVKELLRALPMPADVWRLDDTTHPFASAFAASDVRITTRYDEHHLGTGIFGALHEFGHGLYENGVDPALARTPLGKPASLGLHESQSRMWENLVGRSLPFWRCFFGHVQSAFPSQLAGVGPEEFHRAVNRVEPSLIRVEADELTYDLHVLLRFELEREIVGGELALEDLPEVWNERMHSYLGIDVPNDADGVLQDVHWAGGSFGYFPTYTLGNVIAAQLWEAACAALPALDAQLERGELAPLRKWLREHVHRHGRKLSAYQVVQNVTGGPIEVGPYMRYLRRKFASL